MLPASRRLRLTRDFERAFSAGKTVGGALARVRYMRTNRAKSRFAVVVSAKVSKRAVIRNRIRRRIWAVIAASDFLIPTGLDIIIVSSHEAAKAEYAAIKQEIALLLTKRLHKI